MHGVKTAIRSAVEAGSRSTVVVVSLGLVVGLLIAPVAWDVASTAPATIAVVPIAGFIDGSNAADVSERLQEARLDPSVEAVVLVVNSGGGTSVASEEVFIQVARTADKKPVVAVVDAGALSGGYKAILPADHIYVKPGSPVGSVGTTLTRPPDLGLYDPIITTGPHKTLGTDPRGFEHFVEMVGATFVDHVMTHRGDQLTLTRDEVAHATVFVGIQAVELGLADDIGDIQGAIQHAAGVADVDRYEVQEYLYGTSVRFLSHATYHAAHVDDKSMMSHAEFRALQDDPIVPAVLLVPPGTAEAMAERGDVVAPPEPEVDDA